MLQTIQKLITYDDWANREVAKELHASGGNPPRALQLLSHILAAENVWMARMRSQQPKLPVWPEFTLEDCELLLSQLPSAWDELLATTGETGLEVQVSYKNTKGQTFTNRMQDILLHVIMHSAYHRGQIAMQMRAAGFKPAYTDFIRAVRHEHLTP